MTQQHSLEEISQYQKEQQQNLKVFKEMVKHLQPELYVLIDLLQETNINPLVIWKTTRALNNINIGTGWGKIEIEVMDRIVTFIRGTENDKLNEPISKNVGSFSLPIDKS